MTPWQNTGSPLVSVLRWTALGMVIWPLLGVVVATTIFGMTAVVIDGDSMYPALRRGDVVLSDPAPVDLEPGQVVLFDTGNGRTTHRLVELSESGWVTAGDANQLVDSDAVKPDQIEARGVYVLPYVGWLQTQSSQFTAVFAVGLVAVAALTFSSARMTTTMVAVLVLAGLMVTPGSHAAFVAMTTADATVSASALSQPMNLLAEPGCGLIVLGPYVDLTWQADPIAGIQLFDVQRAAAAAGPFTTITTVAAPTTYHRDQTVNGLTTYWYRVIARAGTWTSTPSGLDDASTGLCI